MTADAVAMEAVNADVEAVDADIIDAETAVVAAHSHHRREVVVVVIVDVVIVDVIVEVIVIVVNSPFFRPCPRAIGTLMCCRARTFLDHCARRGTLIPEKQVSKLA